MAEISPIWRYGHGSDLGQFTMGYLGETGQITARQLASSTAGGRSDLELLRAP